jgi:hypothetical protein
MVIMDTETKNNEFYGILKLINGDSIIGIVDLKEMVGEIVANVQNPVQIFNIPQMTEEGTYIEKVMLQDYVPYSSSKTIVLALTTILFVTPLATQYISRYENFLKNIQEYVTEFTDEEISDENTPDEDGNDLSIEKQDLKKWLH